MNRGNPPLLAPFCVMLVVAQVAGGPFGEFALLASIPIAAWIALRADARSYGPLLLLFLPTSIRQEQSGFFQHTVSSYDGFGFQLTIPLVFAMCAAAKVIWMFVRKRKIPGIPRWLIAIWMLAFLPVIAGAVQGQLMGYNRWSLGLRALLSFGGVFWGAAGVQSLWKHSGNLKLPDFRRFINFAAGLTAVGVITGHLHFLVLGCCASFLPDNLVRRRILGAILCAAVIAIAFANTTLTELFILLVALALGCICVAAPRLTRAIVVRLVAVVCLLMAIALPGTVMLQGERVEAASGPSDSFRERVNHKLFTDRGVLWRSAIDVIARPPYLVVPAGRPLPIPAGLSGGGPVWESSAHNSIVEVFYQAGIPAALAIVAIVVFAIGQCVRLVVSFRGRTIQLLAASTIAVGTVGMATGNFPSAESVGFLLWSLAGLCIAIGYRSGSGEVHDLVRQAGLSHSSTHSRRVFKSPGPASGALPSVD